jgi:hypothetical protein
VQNGDIKEASSVFWSEGLQRTQENCHTAWGKDLYYHHQSSICLMRGLIITIFSRHDYTHTFVHTHLCMYKCVCTVPTLPHRSFCMQGWLGVRIFLLILLTSVLFRVTKFTYRGSVQKANSESIHK